jgi:hypothetical protein
MVCGDGEATWKQLINRELPLETNDASCSLSRWAESPWRHRENSATTCRHLRAALNFKLEHDYSMDWHRHGY